MTRGQAGAAADMPTVSIRRRLEWVDTDASGHQHHSVVLRWVEEAEGWLLDGIGHPGLLGRIPRVHYSVDYRDRLWLHDPVAVRLSVDQVTGSSLTYRFVVEGPRGTAAEGTMIVVHTDGSTGGSAPWPDELRRALTSAAPTDDPGR